MAKSDIMTIDNILNKASQYLTEEDAAFIRKAYEFAEKAPCGSI